MHRLILALLGSRLRPAGHRRCHPEPVELLGLAPKARGVAEWDLGGASLRMTRIFVVRCGFYTRTRKHRVSAMRAPTVFGANIMCRRNVSFGVLEGGNRFAVAPNLAGANARYELARKHVMCALRHVMCSLRHVMCALRHVMCSLRERVFTILRCANALYRLEF